MTDAASHLPKQRWCNAKLVVFVRVCGCGLLVIVGGHDLPKHETDSLHDVTPYTLASSHVEWRPRSLGSAAGGRGGFVSAVDGG
jgi:hypothetical protein